MDFSIVLTGIFVGIAFSAPLGPVNVMTVRSTVSRGFVSGLAVGLGGVAADGIFAAVAAFGVTAILDGIGHHIRLVQALGGTVVLLVGAVMLMREPDIRVDATPETGRGLYGRVAAGFVLTVTNPAPLLGFAALFGGLGEAVVKPGEFDEALLLVAGVIIGSLIWYVFAVSLVAAMRQRIDETWFIRVNRLTGIVLVAGGAVLVASAVFNFRLNLLHVP